MLHTLDSTPVHRISYLASGDTTAWESFVEQCRRVEPHMGPLARWWIRLGGRVGRLS